MERYKKIEEKPIRSLAKTMTWRVIATLTTFLLVFIFTGQIVLALEVGFLEVILKMLLYFLHERLWNSIRWGESTINI